MKDVIKEVNVTKVYGLVKKTFAEVEKLTRVEQEIFFNAINKANLINDKQFCETVTNVSLKTKLPMMKQMMLNLKERLMKLRGQQDE